MGNMQRFETMVSHLHATVDHGRKQCLTESVSGFFRICVRPELMHSITGQFDFNVARSLPLSFNFLSSSLSEVRRSPVFLYLVVAFAL